MDADRLTDETALSSCGLRTGAHLVGFDCPNSGVDADTLDGLSMNNFCERAMFSKDRTAVSILLTDQRSLMKRQAHSQAGGEGDGSNNATIYFARADGEIAARIEATDGPECTTLVRRGVDGNATVANAVRLQRIPWWAGVQMVGCIVRLALVKIRIELRLRKRCWQLLRKGMRF